MVIMKNGTESIFFRGPPTKNDNVKIQQTHSMLISHAKGI
jgi:hypothetical protein